MTPDAASATPSPPAARLRITGVCPAAAPALISSLRSAAPDSLTVVVAADPRSAEQAAGDLIFIESLRADGRPADVRHLPARPAGGDGDRSEAFETSAERLAALASLGRPCGRPVILVTTAGALLQPAPTPAELAARTCALRAGRAEGFSTVASRLAQLDYDHEAVCEEPGQYAVRGGLIDVYPVDAAQPCRLDFSGDVLEEIRLLDPVTQRSGAAVPELTLPCAPTAVPAGPPLGVAAHLPPATAFFVIDPARVAEGADAAARDGSLPGLGAFTGLRMSAGDSWTDLSEIDGACPLFDGAPEQALQAESLEPFRPRPGGGLLAGLRLQGEEDARRAFLAQVAAWCREGCAAVMVFNREGELARAREILLEIPDFHGLQPLLVTGPCQAGFRLHGPPPAWRGVPPDAAGLVLVTESEFFGTQRIRMPALHGRRRNRPHQVDQLLDFSELVEGDHVVHVQHGVAIYNGVTTVESGGLRREALSLQFDDGVTLHVPLQESHLVTRYVGLGRMRPKLGRIGSGRWEKIRGAAEHATLDLAARLLSVQAMRESHPGHAFAADSAWQKEFEGAFPHRETPDQLRAINETKADMEKPRPMDRLVCGDVGFGKTEVAVRAAFKAVMGGRQVAVLAPTTVLAQQHLNTFRERMAGYPVVVEMISRFRSRADQRAILRALRTGGVDILIGTHRLLQRDVRFHNLGLAVIDEEQRFGVRHKEVFKQWRSTIDILSLSATPIPRTLCLALTGARDLSVIETPPEGRRPIQTVVRAHDEALVREAVLREAGRGGQVFYLHNRVATIAATAARLQELLPGLRIATGHGQMDPGELERIMTDFTAGMHDVLVCTTIIESGLDLPNCNTLIIEGADRFGLAQLYQIRGRVGRFRHQAYAYLLLHRHARLLDSARQRLNALRQHTQPGAGFRIAMRDLELRGAGNLLGPEQSGHIAGVGFDLYCQLLRESISRLRGEPASKRIRAAVRLDFVSSGSGAAGAAGQPADGYTALKQEELAGGACPPVEAWIPPSYIPEVRLRIDIHRRLALALTVAEVRAAAAELADRFGPLPGELRALLGVTEIRVLAEQKGIQEVGTESSRLKCLRAGRERDNYVLVGRRFPRLTASRPLPRLREISVFLQNLPDK